MDVISFAAFVFFFYVFALKRVGCTITEPGILSGTVREEASIKWNSNTTLLQVSWGLCSNDFKTVSDEFILVDTSATKYNYVYLNSSRYQGRVEYVGDISKGHAWFVIKNLKYVDAVAYCAELIEGPIGNPVTTLSNVTLKVIAAPTTTSPPTTAILPGKPVLQLHPDMPVLCQGDTINITCNGVTGYPTLTNLTFLQNGFTIGMLNVTTSGNYTKAVLSHALTQPGTLKFSSKATNAAGSSPTSNVVTITVKATTIPDAKGLTTLEKVLIGLGVVAGAIFGGLIVYFGIKYFKYKKSSGQNGSNSNMALGNKVDKEGNDNNQPTA